MDVTTSLKPLLCVQNWAAQVVLRKSKFDSATMALIDLHWPPIPERIDFKIACLVFKCLHNQAPTILSNSLSIKTYARSTRAATNANQDLSIPTTKKKTFS